MIEEEETAPLILPQQDLVGDMTLDEILKETDFSARCISNIRKPWKDQGVGMMASRIRQYVYKLQNITPTHTVSVDDQESRDIDPYSPLPVPDWDVVRGMTLDEILKPEEVFARRVSDHGNPELDNQHGLLVSRVRQYVAKINACS